MPETVLFLCPHSSALSVLAAAFFEKIASERGLDYTSDFAGTEPDDTLAVSVVHYLRANGYHVDGLPRHVTREELAAAHKVISMGCDVSELAPPGLVVEDWDDVPSPSSGIDTAVAHIRVHLDALIEDLEGD